MNTIAIKRVAMAAVTSLLSLLLVIAPNSLAHDANYSELSTSYSITEENDVFVKQLSKYNKGSDDQYTQGLRLMKYQAEDNGGTGYIFGQSMYTPTDITISEEQPNDRPWGGYMFVGLLKVKNYEKHRNITEYNIGMIGPSSYAEDIQVWFHDTVGTKKPSGWEHQLKDEVGINVTHMHEYKLYEKNFLHHYGIAIRPYWGFSLGNVFTHPNVGINLRAGYHAFADHESPSILPTATRTEEGPLFRLYAIGTIDEKVALHNVFIHGSLFRSGPDVSGAETFVTTSRAGLVMGVDNLWGFNSKLTFLYNIVSREFEEQEVPSEYGSLTLSIGRAF